jgi:hypothetical protein
MADKFYEICDNKSHTVTIIKVKNSDEILGGYNPIMWKSGEYGGEYSKTKDSFIFSFNSKKDIKNHILSRVVDEEYAIDNYYSYGPSFGYDDLKLCGSGRSFDNCINYCRIGSYGKQIKTDDYFSIEEYEVFQIIN